MVRRSMWGSIQQSPKESRLMIKQFLNPNVYGIIKSIHPASSPMNFSQRTFSLAGLKLKKTSTTSQIQREGEIYWVKEESILIESQSQGTRGPPDQPLLITRGKRMEEPQHLYQQRQQPGNTRLLTDYDEWTNANTVYSHSPIKQMKGPKTTKLSGGWWDDNSDEEERFESAVAQKNFPLNQKHSSMKSTRHTIRGACLNPESENSWENQARSKKVVDSQEDTEVQGTLLESESCGVAELRHQCSYNCKSVVHRFDDLFSRNKEFWINAQVLRDHKANLPRDPHKPRPKGRLQILNQQEC